MALALIRIEEHPSDHKHFAKKNPYILALLRKTKTYPPNNLLY